MCGIAGIYNLNAEPVIFEDLKKMTDAIIHRGPDGEGQWLNKKESVGFGHRRLSIIDLSENGKQPMHYKGNRYTITFNGEIYNYIELKQELIKRGYYFESECDTEVLLALYDLKKEACLEDLDGMFAFAIWDELEQSLFCARDRFGEKPFHYFKDAKKFVFASEIKQFWSIGINKKMSSSKLNNFVEKGVIGEASQADVTFFDGISKLKPAHYLKINKSGELSIHNYWRIDENAKEFTGTIEQAAEQFFELFKDSVRLRLRSDVPVGSSLSGGLDSSSIVMLIDALKGKELQQNTFSARFKNFAKDEGKYIEEVIKACKNMKVHYTWPDKDYFEEVLTKVCYHQDEPFGSASIVAQYAVMELAKKHQVTVLLDGQGADEQLAGYLPYYSLYLDQLNFTNKKLFLSELKAFQQFHGAVYPYTSLKESETIRMKLGRYKRKLLKQDYFFASLLKTRLINDTCTSGLSELLRYADRNSMAHSREVRLPFLSHKLVEFVFSLPTDYLLHMGWTKYVLRRSMETILPSTICWRTDKIGYEPPQNQWLDLPGFKREIERCSSALGINYNREIRGEIDWRLLMASKFI